METNKKVIFSGIQPSGALHLGNYLGALRNWVALQDEYNCVYCVVDEHAITVRQDPAALRRQTIELFAQLVACGIDPEKSILFIQSHVPAHAELAWVLNCYTMFGELSRMTQFKDKSAKHADNVNAGLFTYPSLMAADIMLYQADLVPVGEDQKQHVELTRNIVQRFNGIYGDVFTMPDAYIPKVGARVMSLNQPDSKMSKSIPEGCVYLMDSPDDIMRKFKRAITDSDTERCVRYDRANKPGVATLIDIYAAVTGKTYEQIEVEFEGKGYGAFKPAVGEVVVELLRPIREEAVRLLGGKAYLESTMDQSIVAAQLSGNANVAIGVNAGILWDINDQWSLAMSYRSRMNMKVDRGTAQMNYASAEAQSYLLFLNQMLPMGQMDPAIPALDQGTFHTELPLPTTVTWGVSYRPNAKWQMAVDLQWIGWSAYKDLNVAFNETELGIKDIYSVKNYSNTLSARFGAEYRALNWLTARAGIYFDESPVDSNYLNPETPSMTKIAYSLGASFRLARSLSLDLAYCYVSSADPERTGSYPIYGYSSGQLEEVFTRNYKLHAHVISFGMRISF